MPRYKHCPQLGLFPLCAVLHGWAHAPYTISYSFLKFYFITQVCSMSFNTDFRNFKEVA